MIEKDCDTRRKAKYPKVPRRSEEQNRRGKQSARNRLHIITANLESELKDTSSEDLLMNQLDNIKCDIIGLSKIRSESESRTTWIETCDELIIGAGSGRELVVGVGFVVLKSIISHDIEVEIILSRIATSKRDAPISAHVKMTCAETLSRKDKKRKQKYHFQHM